MNLEAKHSIAVVIVMAWLNCEQRTTEFKRTKQKVSLVLSSIAVFPFLLKSAKVQHKILKK